MKHKIISENKELKALRSEVVELAASFLKIPIEKVQTLIDNYATESIGDKSKIVLLKKIRTGIQKKSDRMDLLEQLGLLPEPGNIGESSKKPGLSYYDHIVSPEDQHQGKYGTWDRDNY